jgi:hypothetical protein
LDIPFFGSDDEDDVIWQSGVQYVKLVKQDGSSTPPNDHPVELEAQQITAALKAVEYWKEGWFKDKSGNRVFSDGQASILGLRLAEALQKAKPEQDVAFALTQLKTLGLGVKDRAYTAGRAFYKDGRLNVLIGDFERPPDRGRELMQESVGLPIDEHFYNFDIGGRRSVNDLGFSIMTGNGVGVYEAGGKRRNDWLVIDVAAAALAQTAKEQKTSQPGTVDAAELERQRQEAARMQREQRQLREEMARMRKEIRELSAGGANTGGSSIEERLATLDKLYQDKLITKEEYEAKRREILNDI